MPPRPSQVVLGLPEELDRIVGKALEKDRDLRYQSAAEVRADLNRLKRDTASAKIPTTAPNAVPGDKSTDLRKQNGVQWRWVWAGSVVLAVAVAAIWWYPHRTTTLRQNPPFPTFSVRLITEVGNIYRGAISPDGRYVAYTKRDQGLEELHLLQVATGRDVQLTPGSPLRIWSLHFSPDGNYIYFLRQITAADPTETSTQKGVYKIAALGGTAIPLVNDARGFGVTVSPDGNQLAYIAQSSTESFIVTVDTEGSNRRIVARRPSQFGFEFIEWSHSMDTLAAIVEGKSTHTELAEVDL